MPVCAQVRREGSDEVINVIKSRYSAFLDVKVSRRGLQLQSAVENPCCSCSGRVEAGRTP